MTQGNTDIVRVSIRLTRDRNDVLKKIAKSDGNRSIHSLFIKMVDDYIKKFE